MTHRWWRGLRHTLAPLAFWAASAHAEPVVESLGPGIVRHWPDAQAAAQAPPSIALEHPRAAIGPAPTDLRVRPTFTMEQGGRVVHVATPRGTSLYGTGEVGGRLERAGEVHEVVLIEAQRTRHFADDVLRRRGVAEVSLD